REASSDPPQSTGDVEEGGEDRDAHQPGAQIREARRGLDAHEGADLVLPSRRSEQTPQKRSHRGESDHHLGDAPDRVTTSPPREARSDPSPRGEGDEHPDAVPDDARHATDESLEIPLAGDEGRAQAPREEEQGGDETD